MQVVAVLAEKKTEGGDRSVWRWWGLQRLQLSSYPSDTDHGPGTERLALSVWCRGEEYGLGV